jgi:hypothetical protein
LSEKRRKKKIGQEIEETREEVNRQEKNTWKKEVKGVRML